jgi:hypothetical protein
VDCGVTVADAEEAEQLELSSLIIGQEQLMGLVSGDYLMVCPRMAVDDPPPSKDEPSEPYVVRVIGRGADGELRLEAYSHDHPAWRPITVEDIRPMYTVTTIEIAERYLSGMSWEAVLREKTSGN